jgi:hypothetical protein
MRLIVDDVELTFHGREAGGFEVFQGRSNVGLHPIFVGQFKFFVFQLLVVNVSVVIQIDKPRGSTW